MHRRMRLGLGSTLLLLMLVLLAGSGTAFARPPAELEERAEASAVESFDLLDRVWGWIGALAGNGIPDTGDGQAVTGSDFGPFLDPNGKD